MSIHKTQEQIVKSLEEKLSLKSGDVVKLKGQKGPIMTVGKIDRNEAYVYWVVDEQHVNTMDIFLAALELVSSIELSKKISDHLSDDISFKIPNMISASFPTGNITFNNK